jgi:hypothetical protein
MFLWIIGKIDVSSYLNFNKGGAIPFQLEVKWWLIQIEPGLYGNIILKDIDRRNKIGCKRTLSCS